MTSTSPEYRIATFDIETDPFLHGRVPLPFACGFFDGEEYIDFLGDDCIAECMEYIDSRQENFKIFVHNGGGFDFWYLEDFITNPVFFINKKIVKCGLMDRHVLRDSYKMIPVPLAAWNKENIDYSKLERKNRAKHMREIRHYQEMDCRHLFDMVSRFIEEYGDHLTIGSAAMKEIQKRQKNKSSSPFFDAHFRPFYMGGHVECFQSGVIKGDLKLYDVNSLYPFVMASCEHPFGNTFDHTRKFKDSFDSVSFVEITAHSDGALPLKTKSGTEFPHGTFDFFACSHEIRAAEELGILKIKKVKNCYTFKDTQNFKPYVDHFMDKKIKAEEIGDKGGRLFAKLFANNGYGKFGQDPTKYNDHLIVNSMDQCPEGFRVIDQFSDRFIAAKPADIRPWSYKNVAVAASITSAARAVLLDALHRAENPIYCDTDSIICTGLDVEKDQTKIGAWKMEAEGDTFYLGGKKMYALTRDGLAVKTASKGVALNPDEIIALVAGSEPLTVKLHPPVLRAGQPAKFIERKIAKTC